jgi:hypothetical protein
MKASCVRGHEFTVENTRIRYDGYRECRECLREHSRRYKAERFEERKRAAERTQRELSEAARWAPIPGWGGKYEISDTGLVRCVPYSLETSEGLTRHWFGGVVPTRVTNGSPYLSVTLNHGGKSKRYRIHRLVASAFIPNPDGLPVVRHLNDDPLDNRISNLAWGTVSDNMRDVVRNGNHSNARKTHCVRGHALTGDNVIHRSAGRECAACAAWRNSLRYVCEGCGKTRSLVNKSRHAKVCKKGKGLG